MMEQRVTKLEEDMGRITAVLERLEPKINEILLTGAKQADLHRTQVDVAELKGRLVATEEKLGGRIAALEGRMSGLEARVAALPTIYLQLGLIFTTWGIGSGIVFSIAKLAK